MSTPKLFQPFKLGKLGLQHRVVHAPLTRFKATMRGHVEIQPMVKEYYAQRSSTPGTFILTEGTLIHEKVGGFYNVPGIWTDEQIESWKEVTSVVHENGSFIFSQLWALGRVAKPEILKENDVPYTAPSPTPFHDDGEPPRELTTEEIKDVIQLYVQAAKNAVFKASFDGVEIHGANGYLFDQFLQDKSNTRTDQYGGSIANRSRFCLEVVDAVAEAVGAERVGVRLSPWSTYQGMGMKNPIPQFAHFVSELKLRHPNLAYLHVVEPRIVGNADRTTPLSSHESNDFLRAIWSPFPYIAAGGYDRESALAAAEGTNTLITFGRHFLSNPDLPIRLRNNIPLNRYDRKTFYLPGDTEAGKKGYVDYPFATRN